MTDIHIIFGIMFGVVALFIWNRLPAVMVCMASSLALYATGVLTLDQSLAGFGDPAVIFIATLFVVSAGLETAGVTAWAGQVLAKQAGNNRNRLVILIMTICAVLSALLTVGAAVAALLPVVVVTAIRLDRSPAQLLMPLAFGAHAGSKLLLTGSAVNILVAEASKDKGAGGFGYFEFALIGIPLVLGCITIVVLFGERLMPDRMSKTLPTDLSRYATTLIEQYRLSKGIIHLRLRDDSRLIGTARQELKALDEFGLRLIAVQGKDGQQPIGDTFRENDVLLVRGGAEAAAAFAIDWHLSFREEQLESGGLEDTLFSSASGLAEVLIPPRSPLIGEQFFPGMVTPSGDLLVLAIQRRGEDLEPNEPLAAGDTLLLQGTWNALDQRIEPAEVLVVNSPELVRRQAVPMGAGAHVMIGVLAMMVMLLALDLVPPAVAGLLAAGVVLLSGILSVEQLYRSIDWTTVILVGAMLPLSTAIEQTGAAKLLAKSLIAAIGDAGPHALLAGLFVSTAALSQLISNTATALVMIPIAAVISLEMDLSPQPMLICVAVASAGAFLTPVATPANLMIMEPGGYRFSDYWKPGLLMMIWFFIVSLLLIPAIWQF